MSLKYKRNQNKPIYQYQKISYYFKDSDDDNEELEFSYIMDEKKLKALKEKKSKNDSKMNKKLETGNLFSSNSANQINFQEKNSKKISSNINIQKNNKKKKIIVKRKKIKKVNKNLPIHIPLIDKKEEEPLGQNEEEIIGKKSETESFSKEYKDDIKIKTEDTSQESDNNIFSVSHQLLNMPEFFGFEVYEEDNLNNNNFIFDEVKKDKKEVKLKKDKSTKKKKSLICKKKQLAKIKKVDNYSNNKQDDCQNKEVENIDNIRKYKLSQDDLNEFKVFDENIQYDKKLDMNNNLDNIQNNSNNNNDNKERRQISIIDSLNSQKIFIIRIQSIWRAYQIQKKIKIIKIIQKINDKLLNIIENNKKNNFYYFIEKLRNNNIKEKKIKLKNKKQKCKKKLVKINDTFYDNKKLKELIEKEKKYYELENKYEELLKKFEIMKNEIENKNNYYN